MVPKGRDKSHLEKFKYSVSCVQAHVRQDKRVCGEMAERSKAHAWKACRLQKGLKGSNPFLSAI